MGKFHINKQDEVKSCRAKVKCPYGDIESDHFDDVQTANAYIESRALWESVLQIAQANQQKPVPTTARALTAPLGYSGPQPDWIESLEDKTFREASFTTPPEIIDVMDFNGERTTVLWEEFSTNPQDFYVMDERGYRINRIAFHDHEKGVLIGYLKIGYATDESIIQSFGTSLTALHWLEDYEGVDCGFTTYGKAGAEDTLKGKTGEDLLQAKRQVWAKAHTAMKVRPEGLDTSQLTWGSLVNLSASHAPLDEEQLDADLEALNELAKKKLDEFMIDQTPTIDYASIDEKYRGRGLGQAMYIYAGRKLGEYNLGLRASGLQTSYAEAVWKRLAAVAGMPMTVAKQSYKRNGYNTAKAHLKIDFSAS